jgi:hypothetical protein
MTIRQRMLLLYWRDHTIRDYPPTIEMAMRATGTEHRPTIVRDLDALADAGHLVQTPQVIRPYQLPKERQHGS